MFATRAPPRTLLREFTVLHQITIITVTFCCDNLQGSKFLVLENLENFFTYFVGIPSEVDSTTESCSTQSFNFLSLYWLITAGSAGHIGCGGTWSRSS